ncbi:cytochrome c biogenesis protein CcdA [Candidatus Woesearchaeota archaeon]|nr:cytochrome c biogenesis protein CcdA [Candidatus Woesearchaeota archaeon]
MLKNFFIILLLFSQLVFALELPVGVQKIIEHANTLALSVSFLVAFIGGILALTSPCGFVVLPAYFSSVFKERRKALFMTAAFSLGMTLSFLVFGVIAGITGNLFNEYKLFFASFAGVVLVLFGIMTFFNIGFSFSSCKLLPNHTSAGSAFVLGMFFAIGWTPCIGVILGSIAVLSSLSGSLLKSVLMFGAYALGVSLPLFLISLFADKFDLQGLFSKGSIEFGFFGRKIKTQVYSIIAGLLLILIGLIMFFQNGTGFFMDTIPTYLPWTMKLFSASNEAVLNSALLTGTIGSVIGLFLILVLLYIIWRVLKK